MLIQVSLMAIDRIAYVLVEWFLAKWTSGSDGPVTIFGEEFPAQTDGRSAQAKYLRVYFTIMAVSVFATFLRSEWAVTGGGRATKKVFESMLKSVLRAPMSYFETVPMGRILNRFTFDTDVNDVTLTQVMSMFMISCSWYVAGVIIQTTILPWTAFAIFPVSALYWVLMLHYRMSGPDLQRIDALTRSPLQSMVSECFGGQYQHPNLRTGDEFYVAISYLRRRQQLRIVKFRICPNGGWEFGWNFSDRLSFWYHLCFGRNVREKVESRTRFWSDF